ILNIRQGSKISRIFRHLFNQKRVKTVLGGNLALLALISSTYSPSVSALNTITQTDNAVLSPSVVELTTKISRRVPLDNLEITQGFFFFHPGIDFNGVTGDPVYPIMKGKVEAVITDRFSYGKHIIIDHGSGLKSLYAHLSKFEVAVGQEVDTDKVIGQVGSTGRSFGDHLHLEVYENGRTINPRLVLPL
ncbi:MAG: M23 family metallopeptidase, partial [Candidatus Curtissbacteria bacterium]|nr:M23 family metallopeptidase [Candidatus Curtissbacteria bacterium]